MVAALPACPGNWEYTHIPNSDQVVGQRCTTILLFLRSHATPPVKTKLATDTRLMHKVVFESLTPPGFDYYAGNYRGQQLRCLDRYEVGIAGDPSVGHTAATVPMEMDKFAADLETICGESDFVYAAPSGMMNPAFKLFRLIELTAAAFVYFLEIHPYANGNGHMARFLLICLLGRHSVYLNSSFKGHPRPQEPEYSNAIAAYRKGDRDPLHHLLLACL